METAKAWAADVRRQRHIGDFSAWKDHDRYGKAFDRLLRDLRAKQKRALACSARDPRPLDSRAVALTVPILMRPLPGIFHNRPDDPQRWCFVGWDHAAAIRSQATLQVRSDYSSLEADDVEHV